ncbi:MAG TPA: succinate dehydrogenase, hydrophobic membrane anchor protein [Rhizomicrobium sp.]|nr:succinate dehydrogenase, hydrophobic membrane anchor protein [Rhizomicrobium sp.]
MSNETPLHRVQGLGAAHSGTQHFWRERITSVALIPLTIWFGFAALALVGAREVDVLTFFQHPWNAGLMGLFIIVLLIHSVVGMQSVIDDYVQQPFLKVAALLLNRGFAWLVGAICLIALLRIVS